MSENLFLVPTSQETERIFSKLKYYADGHGRNMLTHNLLVSSICSFNKTDEWIEYQPNRSEIIAAAMKSRALTRKTFQKDIKVSLFLNHLNNNLFLFRILI